MRRENKRAEAVRALRRRVESGETTLRELKGIGLEEFEAGVRAGRKLLGRGETQAALEVLAGLALYDPYQPSVWRAIEEAFRQRREPRPAEVFGRLARAMAA
ncbi:MAG TPA: hypothetical protein PK668_10145 [Myxococcota bacterium]|nr:hypothetical protein [Myxococcota bacterium]HRY93473.1 hypothetical protein [Myxococcota bacterium]HSA23357.1 hypothetical protein [Myxococcota bacterium]